MTIELGHQLKSVRSVKGLSLRDVARPAEISVAYLQKLESGEVRQPSPNVLFRLGNVLGVSYETLMLLAGYEIATTNEQVSVLGARAKAESFSQAIESTDLSDEERRAVAAFISHLREQRTRGAR